MSKITMDGLREVVQLRIVTSELEQVRILFDALADTTFIKTTDNEAAAAFYLLQETFTAKLENIAAMLPDPATPLQVYIPNN